MKKYALALGLLALLAPPTFAQPLTATHNVDVTLTGGAFTITDTTGGATALTGAWSTLSGSAVAGGAATCSNPPRFTITNAGNSNNWAVNLEFALPTGSANPSPAIQYTPSAGVISNGGTLPTTVPATDSGGAISSSSGGASASVQTVLTTSPNTGVAPSFGTYTYQLPAGTNWAVSYPATQLPGTWSFPLTATLSAQP